MILFKTAPLVAGAGACDPDGVAAVDVVGELAGVDLGDSDGDDMGGEGGELTVAGEGAVAYLLSTGGEAFGEFAEGVAAIGAGAIAFRGRAANGDFAGEEAGDCRAIVELTNKAATSINTILELAIVEKERERVYVPELSSERSSSGNGAR
ncbi:hypothetical protein K1719_026222 [Acacia pycnantha]|nr:hypothetical protein K1719_026222 [Acacia pycnantha]